MNDWPRKAKLQVQRITSLNKRARQDRQKCGDCRSASRGDYEQANSRKAEGNDSHTQITMRQDTWFAAKCIRSILSALLDFSNHSMSSTCAH